MPRRTPSDRLEKLIAVAAAVFVAHGFRRTQMDDIASGLGVSKGTLYRSVESKDSLFAAVLIFADDPDALPAGGLIPSVALADLSSMIRGDLAAGVSGLELATALGRPAPPDVGAEIELIAADLFAMMERNRIRIMVLDRCAAEVPELAGDWFEAGRYALVELFVEYLDLRATHIASSADHDVLARTIVELLTLWAVKMPWDPAPRPYSSDMADICAAMVRKLVTGDQT